MELLADLSVACSPTTNPADASAILNKLFYARHRSGHHKSSASGQKRCDIQTGQYEQLTCLTSVPGHDRVLPELCLQSPSNERRDDKAISPLKSPVKSPLKFGARWPRQQDKSVSNEYVLPPTRSEEYGLQPIRPTQKYSQCGVKGAWSAEEDAELLELVKQHGTGNWSLIGSLLPRRSGKQCRERYINNLDPTLKKTQWTPEEDEIILSMHQKIGKRWAEISRSLPGRSDNSVKNRWYTTLCRTQLDAPVTIESTKIICATSTQDQLPCISSGDRRSLLTALSPLKHNKGVIFPIAQLGERLFSATLG